MDKTLAVSSCLILVLAAALLFPAPVQANISATPTSLSVGTQNIGAAGTAHTVIISNSSQHDLSILNISSAISQFVVSSSPLPLSLPAQGTASFQVLFQPSAPGNFSGNVQNKGRGTSTVVVAVTGTGIAAAQPPTYLLSGSASSLTFASTLVGTSASQSIAFTNSGTGTLTISQAAVTGAGFALTGFSAPVSVSPGGSVSRTVNFAPVTTGAAAGTLTVLSNAANSPTTISLSGTGVQPQISVVPSSISFPNVSVGTTNTQSLTVRNTGTASLVLSQATLAAPLLLIPV